LLNLINLRKFDESIVEKIKAMPITADIREGVIYQYVKNETLRNVASNMFKEGFALEIISKTTNIPLEDLKKFFKGK
jgi:(2Fe-2S) ferredoxin